MPETNNAVLRSCPKTLQHKETKHAYCTYFYKVSRQTDYFHYNKVTFRQEVKLCIDSGQLMALVPTRRGYEFLAAHYRVQNGQYTVHALKRSRSFGPGAVLRPAEPN